MDVPAKIRSAVGWLGLGKLASQVIGWSASILTIRLLAPEDYGLIAIATVFVSFLALFEELGLRVRLVQMRDLDPVYVRSVYGLSILTNVTLAAGLVAASPLIALAFEESRLTAIVSVLAAQFFVSSIAVIPDAMIKREMNFRVVALIDIGQVLAVSATTLTLAWLGYGVWALVWGSVVGSSIRAVALLVASPYRAWPLFRLRGMASTLGFGGYVTGQRLAWWGYSRLDRLALGRATDTQTLGIYQVALDLAYLPLEKLGSVIAVAAFTGLSRVAHDLAVFRAYLAKGVKLLALVGFPVFFGLGAIFPDLTRLLLGEKWAAAGPIAQVLAIAMPFRMINGPTVEALNSLGRPDRALHATLLVALLVSAGILAGLPWGPLGVAIGWSIAFPAAYLANAVMVSRAAGGGALELLKPTAAPALVAAIMFAALVGLRPLLPWPSPSAAAIGLSMLIGVAIYGCGILLLDRAGLRMLVAFARRPQRAPNSVS